MKAFVYYLDLLSLRAFIYYAIINATFRPSAHAETKTDRL